MKQAIDQVFEDINGRWWPDKTNPIEHISSTMSSMGGDPYVNKKWMVESLINVLEGLPTGLFDSTPYKQEMIEYIKQKVK